MAKNNPLWNQEVKRAMVQRE